MTQDHDLRAVTVAADVLERSIGELLDAGWALVWVLPTADDRVQIAVKAPRRV